MIQVCCISILSLVDLFMFINWELLEISAYYIRLIDNLHLFNNTFGNETYSKVFLLSQSICQKSWPIMSQYFLCIILNQFSSKILSKRLTLTDLSLSLTQKVCPLVPFQETTWSTLPLIITNGTPLFSSHSHHLSFTPSTLLSTTESLAMKVWKPIRTKKAK